MRFTLKQLEYFVAASDMGSIKLAAEKISISQPSISTAIAHLENEFGVQLFVRHHAQGMSLTNAGERMMREAKLLLRQAGGLYGVASELSEQVSGPLSVGCIVTLAPIVMPELVHAFSQHYPGARLSMSEGGPRDLLSSLRRVEIEAAISYDLSVPDEINFEPLASLSPLILLAAHHPKSQKPSLSLKELASEPMILLDLPLSQQYFLGLFQKEGITPNIAARSSSPDVVRTMVANGYGFTIANVRPRNLTALDGQKLVQVKLRGKHKAMTVGIATLKQERKPRILEAFEHHCRNMISDHGIPGMDL